MEFSGGLNHAAQSVVAALKHPLPSLKAGVVTRSGDILHSGYLYFDKTDLITLWNSTLIGSSESEIPFLSENPFSDQG